MRRSAALILISVSAFASSAIAGVTSQAPTCWVQTKNGTGLVSCLNDRHEVTQSQQAAVSIQSSDPAAEPVQDFHLAIEKAASPEDVYGTYALAVGDKEDLKVNVQPLLTMIGYHGGGGGHRGGGGGFHGGGSGFRHGGGRGVGIGGALIGGAILGGALGAATSGDYCDPRYYDCYRRPVPRYYDDGAYYRRY